MVTFRRNPSVEAAPLQQELMLFNLATKKFCVLNASAAQMWSALDQPRTEDELVGALRDHFETSGAASVVEDVRAALGELEKLELITRG
jgi:PqqD family protein of HPr-rel-A system